MTNINSLFDWLLEPIFEELPRNDRLVCKMVCQRWYRILMESRKFRNDRHIYLKNCVINVNQAPASTFMNAVFPYEILTIKSYWVTISSQQDLNQFAQHLGNSVTEVIIEGNFEVTSVFSIINKMPILKSLTVNHNTLHDLAIDFIRIRKEESNLLKLDVLKVNNSSDETPQSVNWNLKIVKLFIKNNVEIIIEKVIIRENSSIENILSVIEVAKINNLHIYTAGRSNEEMEKLLKVNNLSCKSVRFTCPPTESPYPYLETFSNVHPNVKEIPLTCYSLPPKIELPRITILNLSLQMPIQSLKSLEVLTNLKRLEILYENMDIAAGECGFGHDPVNLMHLQELDLGYENESFWSCPACMEALVHSFDNITWFHGSCIISAVTLNSMFYNWKFLKNFWINGETIIFDEKFFSNFDEPRVALEELTLFCHEMILTVDAMTNIFNFFPNLHSFSFYVYDSFIFLPSLQNIVQVVISTIKNLDHLYFSFPGYKLKISEIGIIVEQLETCGYPVDNLQTLMSTLTKLNYITVFELDICHRDKTSTIGLTY